MSAYILALVIALVVPLTGPLERRLYRAGSKTRLKFFAYGGTMILLWTLTLAAVRIEGVERLFDCPASGQDWLWAPAISSILLVIVAAAYAVAGLLPLIQSLRGERWRQAYEAAIRRSFSEIPGLLPNNAAEQAVWILVCVTAGICEEILYRGFLIRFLHESGFGLPLFAALMASSLIFGLAHVYQGAKGIVGTAIGGLAFGCLFLLSGSLIGCIALHVLLDLQMLFIIRPGSRTVSPHSAV
jgi:membrane protease YdiL (CAAX protease family)